jgi:hypothetical protein
MMSPIIWACGPGPTDIDQPVAWSSDDPVEVLAKATRERLARAAGKKSTDRQVLVYLPEEMLSGLWDHPDFVDLWQAGRRQRVITIVSKEYPGVGLNPRK